MKHQNSTHISFKHILSHVHIMELKNTFHKIKAENNDNNVVFLYSKIQF
jgi:predicted nucleotidyltransferase component of viral defense system